MPHVLAAALRLYPARWTRSGGSAGLDPGVFRALAGQRLPPDSSHHQEGKFRSFLLAYLKNFLSEQRRRGRAQKRGGGCEFISLNEPVGEEGYLLEPVDELTPDRGL